MSPTEAKRRWCPYSLNRILQWHLGTNEAGVNQTTNYVYGDPPTPCCIAGDCMAWRTTGGGAGADGYCGLVGEP